MFSLSTFESLYNLHFGKAKLIKEGPVKYLPSDGLEAGLEVKGENQF